METHFSPHEEEPQPQPSSRRSGGPPRKIVGVDVLDSPGHRDDSHRFKREGVAFTAFVAVAVVAIMLAVALFLNR